MLWKNIGRERVIKMGNEFEDGRWVTVGGKRIFIRASETAEDAFNRTFFGKSDYKDLSDSNYADTKDWFKENSNLDDWEEKIFDNEYDESISKYTGESYISINHFLRTGEFNAYNKWYSKEKMESEISEIKKSIEEFDLKSPITVYRTSNSDIFGKSNMSYADIKKLEGKTVTEKSFLSTTTLKELKGEQTVGGKILYKIDVPKGKGRGAFIAKYSENQNEREFLLKNNTNFLVSKVSEKDGKIIVHLKVN